MQATSTSNYYYITREGGEELKRRHYPRRLSPRPYLVRGGMGCVVDKGHTIAGRS